MAFYETTDYRVLIREAVARRRETEPDFTLARLAETIQVQQPYLSKVLNGQADFNSDQLYLACRVLKIEGKERDYLNLLLEFSRSSLPSRREELKEQIKGLQNQALDAKKYLSYRETAPAKEGLVEYYLYPINQLVHVCLSIDRYREKLNLLASHLGFSAALIGEALDRLEAMKVITREKGKIRVLIGSIHLPKDATVFGAWRDQLRILSLQRLRQIPPQDAVSFSMIFSMDEDTKRWFHGRFLSLLKEAETKITKAKAVHAYQMNFDLFRWTQESK